MSCPEEHLESHSLRFLEGQTSLGWERLVQCQRGKVHWFSMESNTGCSIESSKCRLNRLLLADELPETYNCLVNSPHHHRHHLHHSHHHCPSLLPSPLPASLASSSLSLIIISTIVNITIIIITIITTVSSSTSSPPLPYSSSAPSP